MPRYYSNLASETELVASVSDASTSLSLASVTGLPPATPFTLVVDVGETNEEVVTVNAVVGTTVTVLRGQDNTTAAAHVAGAKVRHMVSARDFSEPQAHMSSSAGVHGVVGAVVGATDAQALTNKTINGSLNTLSNVPKGALPATTVYTTDTQTLTNKTISGSANTLTNVPQAALPTTSVSTTGTQTLTNKTIDSASNTVTLDGSTITGGTVSKSRLPSDTVYGTYTFAGGTSAFTAKSGWTVSASSIAQVSGRVYVLILFATRSGGDLVASAGGNLTDTDVATANATYRPAQQTPGNYVASTTGGGALLGSDGVVTVTDAHSNSTISTGDTVRATFTFIN